MCSPRIARAGNDGDVVLNRPSQQYLCRTFLMPLGDGFDLRHRLCLLRSEGTAEAKVASEGDAVLIAVLDDLLLVIGDPRMIEYLVDRHGRSSFGFKQRLNVIRAAVSVAHADLADLPLCAQLR